jgi:hypothetical protein
LKNIKKLVTLLILTLLILPATNVIGTIINEEENKTQTLEYTILNEDGSKIIKQMTVDENDITEFNEIIEEIFKEFTLSDIQNLTNTIKNLKERFGQNKIMSIILNILGMRPLQKRVLILSNGYGPILDLNLKKDISMIKKFSLWYYLGVGGYTINSKTLIIDLIPDAQLQFYRLIEGQQIGLMTRFKGFYMKIPGNLQEQKQSHTFFIGYASKVRAFDLPDL